MKITRTLVTRTLAIITLVTAAAVAPVSADVVTDWNAITLTVANAGNRPAPAIILDIAMSQIAVHDAIQAYQGRFATYNPRIPNAAGSPVAGAARAARDVLVDRFPAQAAAIEATYQTYLTARGLFDTDPGAWVGQQSALRILIRRTHDGSYPANAEVFVGGTAPGEWRPTPTGFAPMSAPWFGRVEPFNAKWGHRAEDEAPPPPHLESRKYARAYQEVQALGARFNSARTAEQTDLAYFYSDNFFSQLNRAVRAIADAHLVDIGDSARLLALANIAAADALMTAWDHKRTYFFWRPSTAIVEGDHDGNPDTVADPTWLPLINNPPYPDYTSGANSITAAFMRILSRSFGDDALTFDLTSNVAQVVRKTRTYTRFSDVAADVVNARVYLGIHFRFADTVARRQGEQAADSALRHLLRPVR
jgi:hypothetical protein